MKLLTITTLLLLCQRCSAFIQHVPTKEIEVPIDINIKEDVTWRSSEQFEGIPDRVTAELSVNNEKIELRLRRNPEITDDVPVLLLRRGKVRKYKVPSSEIVAPYDDTNYEASVLIWDRRKDETEEQLRFVMFGTFFINNHTYLIQPPNEGSSSRHTVAQITDDQPVFSDYMKPPGYDEMKLSSIRNTETDGDRSRYKRQIEAYEIEVFIVVDFTVYTFWYDKTNGTAAQRNTATINTIKQFYSFVINAMNIRYQTVTGRGFTITCLFAGIYIADTSSGSSFIPIYATGSGSVRSQIRDTLALNAFKTWANSNLNGTFDYDAAMLFTAYDIISVGSNNVVSTSTAGYAFLGALCGDSRYSIQEDHFKAGMVTIAAHELGHNLNANHDGDGNSCSASTGNVMASLSNSVLNKGQWAFSSCSLDYFENYVAFLENTSNSFDNCMRNRSNNFNASALDDYANDIAGQVYVPDQQCEYIRGSGSYLERSFYNGSFSRICEVLACTNPSNSLSFNSALTWEGTSCGDGKLCKGSNCVESTSAPTGLTENCVFGSWPGNAPGFSQSCSEVLGGTALQAYCYQDIFEFNCCEECNVHRTNNAGIFNCTFGDKVTGCGTLSRFGCYTASNEADCCSHCNSLAGNIPGCKYGDKAIGCTLANCADNSELCCETCATTTTTSTTTTSTTSTTTSTTTPTTTSTTTTAPTTTSTTTTPPTTTSTTTTPPTTTSTTTTAPTTTSTTTTPPTTTSTTTTPPTTTSTTTTPPTTTSTTTTPPTTTSTTTTSTTTPTTTCTTTTTPTTTSTTTTTPTTTSTTTTPPTTTSTTTTPPTTTSTTTTPPTTTSTTTTPLTTTSTTTTPPTTTSTTTTPPTTTSTTATPPTTTSTTTTPLTTTSTTTTPPTTTSTTTTPPTTTSTTTTPPTTTSTTTTAPTTTSTTTTAPTTTSTTTTPPTTTSTTTTPPTTTSTTTTPPTTTSTTTTPPTTTSTTTTPPTTTRTTTTTPTTTSITTTSPTTTSTTTTTPTTTSTTTTPPTTTSVTTTPPTTINTTTTSPTTTSTTTTSITIPTTTSTTTTPPTTTSTTTTPPTTTSTTNTPPTTTSTTTTPPTTTSTTTTSTTTTPPTTTSTTTTPPTTTSTTTTPPTTTSTTTTSTTTTTPTTTSTTTTPPTTTSTTTTSTTTTPPTTTSTTTTPPTTTSTTTTPPTTTSTTTTSTTTTTPTTTSTTTTPPTTTSTTTTPLTTTSTTTTPPTTTSTTTTPPTTTSTTATPPTTTSTTTTPLTTTSTTTTPPTTTSTTTTPPTTTSTTATPPTTTSTTTTPPTTTSTTTTSPTTTSTTTTAATTTSTTTTSTTTPTTTTTSPTTTSTTTTPPTTTSTTTTTPTTTSTTTTTPTTTSTTTTPPTTTSTTTTTPTTTSASPTTTTSPPTTTSTTTTPTTTSTTTPTTTTTTSTTTTTTSTTSTSTTTPTTTTTSVTTTQAAAAGRTQTSTIIIFPVTVMNVNFDDTTSASYIQLRDNILIQLRIIYVQVMGSTFGILIINRIRLGSLIVEYTVEHNDDPQGRADFTEANRQMLTGERLVTVANQSVAATSVKIGNTTFTNTTISGSICEMFAATGGCNSGYNCVVVNNMATCEPEKTTSGIALVLAIAVGLPVFLILVLICIGLILRAARMKRLESRTHSKTSSSERYGSHSSEQKFPSVTPYNGISGWNEAAYMTAYPHYMNMSQSSGRRQGQGHGNKGHKKKVRDPGMDLRYSNNENPNRHHGQGRDFVDKRYSDKHHRKHREVDLQNYAYDNNAADFDTMMADTYVKAQYDYA